MKIKYTILFACATALLTSCKEEIKEPDNTAETKEVAAAPVNIEAMRFKMKTHNEQEVESKLPTMDIYIYTWERTDSVFLATDIAALNMNDIDSRHLFDMPKDCAIAINSYFAGTGNVYYGVAKDNALEVFIGTPSPDGVKTNYKPFKTFTYFDGRIDTQEFSTK